MRTSHLLLLLSLLHLAVYAHVITNKTVNRLNDNSTENISNNVNESLPGNHQANIEHAPVSPPRKFIEFFSNIAHNITESSKALARYVFKRSAKDSNVAVSAMNSTLETMQTSIVNGLKVFISDIHRVFPQLVGKGKRSNRNADNYVTMKGANELNNTPDFLSISGAAGEGGVATHMLTRKIRADSGEKPQSGGKNMLDSAGRKFGKGKKYRKQAESSISQPVANTTSDTSKGGNETDHDGYILTEETLITVHGFEDVIEPIPPVSIKYTDGHPYMLTVTLPAFIGCLVILVGLFYCMRAKGFCCRMFLQDHSDK